MAAGTRYECFFFGQWGGYEEYYAFGLTYEDVYNTLWEMYIRNCDYNDYEPTEEDKETFNDEVWIQEFRGVNIINGFGFNTKNSGKLYHRDYNHLTKNHNLITFTPKEA